MVVMPTANVGFDCGLLFGRYPGRLGHLFSPDDKSGTPRTEFPWALDNGVFGAWSGNREWDAAPLYDFLDKYNWLTPSWVAVPDWVGDRDKTMKLWDDHSPALLAYGMPLAMVVQDGMEPKDVPPEATVVFVGGNTEWKWRNLNMWTEAFPRVHVGRVNSHRLLWMAHESGAESCDGTGWFRGGPERRKGLIEYLEESSSGKRQTELQIE